MADIIKLLSESVANQIAAGEVVQRPASIVKELMENSIDAGSTEISLVIKEGGSTLVQVIDNGQGMSEMDARMCWERHATSKIESAADIFSIHSYGFRGEAMASIGAVAQVEMKTMREGDEIGTLIRVEGSVCKEQKPVGMNPGTQISVRNLFFNTPARRNFLKSVSVETKHIIEEFHRVALARPDLALSFMNNDREVYKLEPASLHDRIEEIFTKKKNDFLLAVEEDTDIVKISGYTGTPDTAKSTRGEQYIFVNKRFIKNPYFNHAIAGAYEGIIEKSKFPLYVLHLEIDPEKIDVNIHPTKTEVKFEDERYIYILVNSAIKKALGQHTLTPLFENEDKEVFNPLKNLKGSEGVFPSSNPLEKKDLPKYNPFESGDSPVYKRNLGNWEKVYGDVDKPVEVTRPASAERELIENEPTGEDFIPEVLFQLKKTFIVTKKDEKLLILDQRLAHERVLYERYKKGMDRGASGTQQLLFPRTVNLSASDMQLVHELEEEIKKLGFDFSEFGKDAIIINGIPPGADKGLEVEIFEGLIEQYKFNMKEPGLERRESMLRSMALNSAVRRNTTLNEEEMKELVQQLFLCENHTTSPRGHSIGMFLDSDNLDKMIN
jgi:DNA mismatch repair protein MutL